VIDFDGQSAGKCEQLLAGERVKHRRGCRAYLLLKCCEPLAEYIDAGVLLLERLNLALLGRKLPVFRLQPLSKSRVSLACVCNWYKADECQVQMASTPVPASVFIAQLGSGNRSRDNN
jgi:hypothetical protein